MAQVTPHTPVHLTFGTEFAEDTPVDPAAMSPTILKKHSKPSSKHLTKKQKLQAAFAALYDDGDLIDLQSPVQASTWTAGRIAHTHTVDDITMEDVGDQMIPDVKGDNVDVATKMVTEKVSVEGPAEGGIIRTEWLGTSHFYLTPLLDLQKARGLDAVIAYREAVARDVACFPHDPVPILTLSSINGQLGFSDIAAANAYRAFLLIEAAMSIKKSTLINGTQSVTKEPASTVLNTLAKDMLSIKYHGLGPHSIEDELQHLHRQAYQMLLAALLGTGANWEGLLLAKTALKLYPEDLELKELQHELKEAFRDRSKGFKEIKDDNAMNKADMLESSRMGKIYQKKYPWMDQDLYKRTPATLREANMSFEGSSCEVKEVTFDNTIPKSVREGDDVGPLGIFAVRDIEEGDLVMVDTTITGVSSVSSSKLEHCDACQGCLMPGFVRPEGIVRPACCSKAIYCSPDCYNSATTGYHKVLCGQDFDWLYNQIEVGKTSGAPSNWKAVSFLRIVAVVLADCSHTNVHPLRHTLLSRMSANYPPEGKILDQFNAGHQWLYFTNVVAPTLILLQLGVNIFTDPFWTQEVIQTIVWKIENNANMAVTELIDGNKVHLVNINPNYLFFNHSCQPNISWHACPDGTEAKLLVIRKGEALQPGCSAVWCTAARDIKKGEQLTISYVGDPKGNDTAEEGRLVKRAWLGKWFDNGCGCPICEEENRVEAYRAKERAAQRSGDADSQTKVDGVVHN